MNYQDSLHLLSQCGIGAMVLSEDRMILAVNETGDHLLHGEGKLSGRPLPEQMLALSMESGQYVCPAFGEYVLRCPSPEVSGLPEGSQLITFRDASKDARHDMLTHVVNQMSDAMLLCDAESRILLLNDPLVQMECIETKNVLGENVSVVYSMRDGTDMNIPEVIRTKKPKRNHRQHYTTRYGRNVDAVSNHYPIIQNGQVLGGFSIHKDLSTVNDLHNQLIDLREKLRTKPADEKGKGNTLSTKYHFEDIIHISASMNQAVSRCRQVAQSDSSVMLYGETGTGKELFAQSIHNASRRADGPFLAINCAAIPENLLESLLFGTEKGAYTGAERRPGLFEQADGGTLLLDEINSMNITLQAKLLRVLQDGMVRRVGGASEIRVDVRVLSNINIPTYQAIEENKLRRDLFYRLGVVNINIPPLRERREDIPILAKTFIMQCNEKMERNVQNIDQAVLEQFNTYAWPGNVRELQHAIEYTMNILPDDMVIITPEYLPEHIFQAVRRERTADVQQTIVPDEPHGALNTAIHGMEYSSICAALRESGGNISQAARKLQMSRQNLQYRIKKYQINVKQLCQSLQ